MAYATQAPFFIALSGITYAILSASWDEDVRDRTRLWASARALLVLGGSECGYAAAALVAVSVTRVLLHQDTWVKPAKYDHKEDGVVARGTGTLYKCLVCGHKGAFCFCP